MPQYDFLCQDCKKTFSKVLTLSEYERGKATCPECGSRKVEQELPPFPCTSQKGQSQNVDSWEVASSSAGEEDDRARVLSDWEGEGGAPGAEK